MCLKRSLTLRNPLGHRNSCRDHQQTLCSACAWQTCVDGGWDWVDNLADWGYHQILLRAGMIRVAGFSDLFRISIGRIDVRSQRALNHIERCLLEHLCQANWGGGNSLIYSLLDSLLYLLNVIYF
jgi:hypothetical protein